MELHELKKALSLLPVGRKADRKPIPPEIMAAFSS